MTWSVPQTNRYIPSPARVSPATGNDAVTVVTDPAGPRVDLAKLPITGYAYDKHRGIDLQGALGDPVYAWQAGVIGRSQYEVFDWTRAEQLTKWVESDPSSSATFTRITSPYAALRITGSRVGAQTFPTQTANFYVKTPVFVAGGPWESYIDFAAIPAITGGVVGFGFVDFLTNQYVSLEYDGTTLTARGVDASGTMTASGTSAAVSRPYLRCTYDPVGDDVFWQYSLDVVNWTTLASETSGVAFTNESWPAFVECLYWRSLDTNAAPQIIDIAVAGYYDQTSVPRFGNCPMTYNQGSKTIQSHFSTMLTRDGAIVEAGELIGYVGKSGAAPRILTAHFHNEFSEVPTFVYLNTDVINPRPYFPWSLATNNTTLANTTGNSPYSPNPLCHIVRVRVTRDANQSFAFNQLTVTGNLGSRTFNLNTLVGINPVQDIPVYNDVGLEPVAFTGVTPEWELYVYVDQAAIGNTFVSAQALDANGTLVASLP